MNSQTLVLRNPADTQSLTFVNPAITSSYTAQFMDAFDYMVMKDGSNYVAKRDNWALESSNSNAKTVIQYAIDNAGIGGTVAVKGVGSANYFPLTSQLSLVDKNVFLTGINSNNNYNAAVLQKNYATAEPLINIVNTTFTTNGLRNIGILGNSTAGSTGIKFYLARQGVLDNVSVTLFDTGIEASGWVDCDIRSLRSKANLTYGINMNNLSTGSSSGGMNTCRFYGGSISSNPTNLIIASNSAGDVQFFGTEFEGANTGYVNGVNIAAGSNNISFICCSFEKNQQTTPVVILDDGNNNLYSGCRFDSDVSYTPIHLTSAAKNIKFIGNFFQTNTAATTSTILIDAGAVYTTFISNMKSTNTSGTVTLTDNGTLTTKLGNSQMGTGWNDRVPTGIELGSEGLRLMETSTGIVSLRDSGNTLNKNFVAGTVGMSQLRTTGQTNMMTLTSTLIQNLVANQFDLQNDHKVITIPADPASGFVRLYSKAVDANNDGWFVKRKINGAVVEVML